MCQSDVIDPTIDINPHAFVNSRRDDWPDIDRHEMGDNLADIYHMTKATGLPNALSAPIPIPSDLNVLMWEKYLSSTPDHRELLDFITFGFLLGYMGPASDSRGTDNHNSATQFPEQINKFISKEIEKGGSSGPWLNHLSVSGVTYHP